MNMCMHVNLNPEHEHSFESTTLAIVDNVEQTYAHTNVLISPTTQTHANSDNVTAAVTRPVARHEHRDKHDDDIRAAIQIQTLDGNHAHMGSYRQR